MTTNQTSPALSLTPEADPRASRGVLLPCPKCGKDEVQIQLDLDDLRTCTCRECGEDFTLDDVRDLIEKWSRVLRAVDSLAASLAE
jgi:hypothetical protein